MPAKRFTRSLRLPAAASLIYVGIGMFTKGIGFLITPIFTRAMSEGEYGSFTLYISTLGITTILVSSFTHGSSFFVGLKKYEDEKSDFFISVILTTIVFSLLICTLLFAFSRYFGLNRQLLLALTLQLILDCVVSIYLCALRFSYRYKSIAAITVFEAVTAPIFAILLINVGVAGDYARVLSLLSVSFITAIYSFYMLHPFRGRVRLEVIKYNLKISFPHIPSALSSAVTAQADKLIITALLGAVALAKYSVAHSLGIALSFLVTAIGSALTPWIVRHLESDKEEKIPSVILLIFKILSMLTLFLVALSPEALRFLAPLEYSEALSAVLPIALSTIPAFLLSVSSVGIIRFGKSRYSVYIALLGAAFNILLNFMLIPYFGYLGAGIALLLSKTVEAVISVFFLGRCTKSYLPKTNGLLSLSALTLLMGVIIALSYRDLPLRILLLAVPSVIAMNSLFSAKNLILEN